jgi:peptidoglycan hydrolase-like protein with peptidoglycan-binding domain
MKNRFLISEEERNRILGMHLNEQSTQQPVQPQPTSTFKMGVKNDKVTQIQNKLNEKFKAGLVPDGLWGPKTASAVAKYLPQLKQPVTNTTPNTTTDDKTLVNK